MPIFGDADEKAECFCKNTDFKSLSRIEIIDNFEWVLEKVLDYSTNNSEEEKRIIKGVKMEREILFRAKRIDNGKWVKGDFYYSLGDNAYIITEIKVQSATQAEPEHNYQENYYIDPDTLGQYTGLNDINGVKIFEGDLLGFVFSDDYTTTKIVKYISDRGQFCVADINDLEHEQYWDIWSRLTQKWIDKLGSRCKIIGNIHEKNN